MPFKAHNPKVVGSSPAPATKQKVNREAVNSRFFYVQTIRAITNRTQNRT